MKTRILKLQLCPFLEIGKMCFEATKSEKEEWEQKLIKLKEASWKTGGPIRRFFFSWTYDHKYEAAKHRLARIKEAIKLTEKISAAFMSESWKEAHEVALKIQDMLEKDVGFFPAECESYTYYVYFKEKTVELGGCLREMV